MDVLVNVDEIAAALSTAEEKATGAGAHFDQAATALGECCQALGQAVQGTGDQALGQALEALTKLSVEPLKELVKRAITTAANYRQSLVGQPPPDPQGPAPTTPASSSARKPPEEPADVKAARAQLPPPVVKGTGAKTHGRWTSPDAPGDLQPIVSGRKDDLYGQTDRYLAEKGMERYSIASHVETKLAVHMATTGMTSATVTINHTPCEGDLSCDTLLPQVLPEGATLTVYGTKADGGHTVKTYTGRKQK
jgi:hypothetical protein